MRQPMGQRLAHRGGLQTGSGMDLSSERSMTALAPGQFAQLYLH